MSVRYYLGLLGEEIKTILGYRNKPLVIQMPITSRCNSKCLTCNIWKYRDWTDINPSDLKRTLESTYFENVHSVGINGGEPSIHPQFQEVIKAILSLKHLKDIYVISNCIGADNLLSKLEDALALCHENNVKLHLQISIDGIETVHNRVRGVNVSFERSTKVLTALTHNPGKFVDDYNIGCSCWNANFISKVLPNHCLVA